MISEEDPQFPRVVLVHMSTFKSSNRFFAKFWPNAITIGDPEEVFYEAFGVSLGSVSQFFRPEFWRAFFRAVKFGNGRLEGTLMRNPGAFLIQGTRVLFKQEFEHFGIPVDVKAVRAAVDRARGGI